MRHQLGGNLPRKFHIESSPHIDLRQFAAFTGEVDIEFGALLRQSRPFSAAIDDTRLALEVAVIQTLAERLVALLSRRDPLSERVHLGKAGVAGFGLLGLLWGATRRVGRVRAAGRKPQDA